MSAFEPKHGFSVSSLFITATNVTDLHEDGFSHLVETDRLDVIIPEPTKWQRSDYGLPARGDWQDSDGEASFRDSFFPLMNSMWPVELAYGRSEREAADLMNKYAGAVTLVRLDGDKYYVCMTGGGMDLTWHLAAGYVCCGAVPPVALLENLRRSPFERPGNVTAAILKAARRGKKHLDLVSGRLRDDLKEITREQRARTTKRKAAAAAAKGSASAVPA